MKALRGLVMVVFFAFVAVMVSAGGAAAQGGLSVTVNTADALGIAATVLAGLGALWGVRKCIKLVNRS
jgi:hypothetical protein